MTLVEMMVVGMVLGAGLFLLTGWMATNRLATKRDLAVHMLEELDKALVKYHRAAGQYPPSYGPNSAITATTVLLDHERTRKILDDLPPSLWRGPGHQTLLDPWGTPLRYYATVADSPAVKTEILAIPIPHTSATTCVAMTPDRRVSGCTK
jgi:type II secretory pathway pseudopilin PulG